MKAILTIEVEIHEGIACSSDEEKQSIRETVFKTDGTLLVHSNELGCTIGNVSKIDNFKWDEDTEAIKELHETKATLIADGYKEWSYVILTIDKAIKALRHDDDNGEHQQDF